MPKVKSVYACTACGYEAPRWVGRCPGCGATLKFDAAEIDGDGENAAADEAGTSGPPEEEPEE